MTEQNRTDRAIQGFLDSLSQLPGSILYRDQYEWMAIAPTAEGQVLRLDADLKPVWLPPPAGSTEPLQSLSPLYWFDVSQEGWSDGETPTALTDFGANHKDLQRVRGAAAYDQAQGHLVFDGITDVFQHPPAIREEVKQPLTFVIVAEFPESNATQHFFDAGTSARSSWRNLLYESGAAPGELSLYGDSRAETGSALPFPRAVYIIESDYPAADVFRDGVSLSTPNWGNNPQYNMTLGNSLDDPPGFNGRMNFCELAMLGYILNAPEKSDLTAALINKWEITP